MGNKLQVSPPILLITFNRPDTTKKVIEAIRAERPEQLFVASDGPRHGAPKDVLLVGETRRLIEGSINWPCEVKYLYSDVNQGCRVSVSSAIDWFFDNVEEGIILEDDCLPHPDFFSYCAQLLDRYRHDDRVMMIAGDNSVGLTPTEVGASYAFTHQALIWGWATWRRAWQHYDGELESWKVLRTDQARLKEIWPDAVKRRWQIKTLDTLLHTGKPDTWAYRWAFTLYARGGLSATPSVNLISNIGFGPGATHTFGTKSPLANVASSSILPLRHPAAVVQDQAVERQIFDRAHGGATLRSPVRRLVASTRRVIGRSRRTLIRLLPTHRADR